MFTGQQLWAADLQLIKSTFHPCKGLHMASPNPYAPPLTGPACFREPLKDTHQWLRNGLSGLLLWDGILEGREHAEGWAVSMLWPLYSPAPGSVSPPEPVSLQQVFHLSSVQVSSSTGTLSPDNGMRQAGGLAHGDRA